MDQLKVHVHIYDQNSEADDNLVAEFDLDLIESYEDPDGYEQYGFERNGEWFEIRISK